MSLFKQLPNGTKCYICVMENLYMSPKFAKKCFTDTGKEVMIHGVCRPSRGIPKCIQQTEVTKKEEVLKSKNTVKAAELVGDSNCPHLISLSFYDSKPVYFVSNACTKLK